MKITIATVSGIVAGMALMIVINDGIPDRGSIRYLLPLAGCMSLIVCISLAAAQYARSCVIKLAEARKAHAALLAEHAEVMADYNKVVVQLLRQRQALTSFSAAGRMTSAAMACNEDARVRSNAGPGQAVTGR